MSTPASFLVDPDPMIIARATADVDMTPQVIFNVLPPTYGQSLLTLLLFTCLLLGANVMEFFNHLAYDLKLMAKPGWTDPLKCVSRLAYFACRYFSITCVSFFMASLTLPAENCMVFPYLYEIPGIILFASTSLTFALRTTALYKRDKRVVIPVFAWWTLTFAASAVCIVYYVPSLHIPGTQFCAYGPARNYMGSLTSIVVYKVTGFIFDTALFVLTLHRLLEGGLKSLFTKRTRKVGDSRPSLSAALVRQGLHFYALQLVSDIIFVSGYWGIKDPFLRVFPSAISMTVPALAAAGAFRGMGRTAKAIGLQNALHVNEIVNSNSNNPSSHGSSRNRNVTGFTDAIGAATTAVGSFDGHGKTTVVSLGGTLDGSQKKKSFLRTNPDPSDVESVNGIVVTVGTVTRSDPIEEEEWEGHETSRDAIRLQRTWSQASKGEDAASVKQAASEEDLEAVRDFPAQEVRPATRADTVSETGVMPWLSRGP